MKSSLVKRPRLSLAILKFVVLTPFVLLVSGCSKSDPVPAPSISPAQTLANKIKSVEDDPRMPADVKAKEIARIKAESQ